MPSPTYAELIVPVTKDEQLATLLALAVLAEFPTTAWQPGSVAPSLLDIEAEAFAEFSAVIADIAKGGILEDATGKWLEILLRNNFNLTTRPEAFTQGAAVLTCAANAGPYTIDVNELWATDAGGHRFNNITGGTLALGGTLSLSWQAEFGGNAYNLAPGTLNLLATPLPGVTVNNPATLWITRYGTDAETTVQQRQRAKDRWPEIGSGATEAAYRLWALSAGVEAVRRVKVLAANNLGTPDGGHVTVYLASNTAGIGSGDVLTVDAYVQARRPLCVTVHVASAVVVPLAVEGTLYVASGYGAAALGLAQTNLLRLQSETGIGATVYKDGIIEVLMEVPGASRAPLTTPAGNTALGFADVVSFVPTLTIVEV
jgi:uncharacterized phage protein gp47/JayE